MIKQILLWLGSAALTALLLIGFGAMTGCYVAPIQHEVTHKSPPKPVPPKKDWAVCPDFDVIGYCHRTAFNNCRNRGNGIVKCERKLIKCARRVCSYE